MTTPNTTTPRTDAIMKLEYRAWNHPHGAQSVERAAVDLARQLEQELAEANKRMHVSHFALGIAIEERDAARAELADNERWMHEVLADFLIPFDDHKVGMRLAFTQWMAEAQSARAEAEKWRECVETFQQYLTRPHNNGCTCIYCVCLEDFRSTFSTCHSPTPSSSPKSSCQYDHTH